MEWLIVLLIVAIVVIAFGYIVLGKKEPVKKEPNKKGEDIEILIYQDELKEKNSPVEQEKEAIEVIDPTVSDDTLNLDELFKTMSIHVMKNEKDFDFGLKNGTNNVKKDVKKD